MKRYLSSSSLVLTAAVAVVTGTLLLVTTLYDFYYRNPSPGFEGQRIVLLSAKGVRSGHPASIFRVTAEQVLQADLGLSHATAFEPEIFVISKTGSLPRPVVGVAGTSEFLRVFAPSSSVPAVDPQSPTLVLTRTLAGRLFTEPANAIGESLRIDGQNHVVSAVTNDIEWPIGLFSNPAPIEFFLLSEKPPETLTLMAGRLRDNVNPAQVEQRLDRLLKQPYAWPPEVVSSHLAGVVQTLDDRSRLAAPWAPGLLTGCLLLLLLAIGTAAQLVLQRGHDQSREWLLHSVLGATWKQIIFLHLKRLSPALIFGVVIGGAAAVAAIRQLGKGPFFDLTETALMTDPLLISAQIGLAFVVCTGLVTFLPVLSLRKAEFGRGLLPTLRHSRWSGRLQTAFPALQLALLAAIVTTGYGLSALYSQKLENAASIYQKDLFFVRIGTLPVLDPTAEVRHVPELVRSLETDPRVKELALSHFYLPLLSDGTTTMRIAVGDFAQLMTFRLRRVSPNFFEVVGLDQPARPLDRRLPNRIVVSTSLREILGLQPDDYPLTLRAGESTLTAVGETSDTMGASLTELSGPALYRPLVLEDLTRWPSLLIRSDGSAADVQHLVESELLRLKVSAWVAPVISAQGVVEERMALTRFFYRTFLFLGLVVLFVSLCSVAATVHRETSRRIHEVAVRRAVGATSASVGFLLLRRLVAAAFLGAAVGVLLGIKVAEVLIAALDSFGNPGDAVLGFAIVFSIAILISTWSFISASRTELSELLRKV